MKKILSIFCLLMLALVLCVAAQREQGVQKIEDKTEETKQAAKAEGVTREAAVKEMESSETESKVPELMEFHKVIYKIWHDAYPNKDYAALKSMVPEVNNLAEKVYNATLPGILRDREARWEEGVTQLRKAVEAYNSAAKGANDETLLHAAELLHSRFEMMVRIVWPVSKEVNEFHKVLYVIYHRYLPEKEFDKIRSSSGELVAKAEAIVKTQPPKRIEKKSEQFVAAAQALLEASKGLDAACKSSGNDTIETSVLDVHAKYQNLEKIFE